MNILFNMPSQSPGQPAGVGRFGHELLRRLVANGHAAYTLRSRFDRQQLPGSLGAIENLIRISTPSFHAADIVLSSLGAPVFFPRSRFDIVVNVDPLGLFLGGGNRVTIVHDLYFAGIPGLYSRPVAAKAWALHWLVLSRSTAIVAISESTADDICRFFPTLASRVQVILSDSTMTAGADDRWLARLKAKRFVLTVANAAPNKNLGTLAKAFCSIARTDPGLMLVHVGSDPHGLLSGVMADEGMSARLIRHSGIADSALAALYESALCLVVPSFYEGFCLPLVEAQRYGCPVLFADSPGTGETGGMGGVSFRPDDLAGLAECLGRIVASASLRATMRTSGHRNALRFSWERAARQYEQVFDAIARLRSPG
ncbi:MAG: glycosyltransferase family 1 protein [Sphingomonas sp.]|nr:MAG: glycosyltransferase family 1 protein [Sphingomonas sp.]